MKILTVYSESHRVMYEGFFLPSFSRHLKDNFELHTLYAGQHCPSGRYQNPGWRRAMLSKVEWYIDHIEPGDPEPLVLADCDIQFFGCIHDDLLGRLGDFDIMFQGSAPGHYCSGFMVLKQTQSVLNFFKRVKAIMVDSTTNRVDDQTAVNKIIARTDNIKVGTLPRDKYFDCHAALNGRWRGRTFDVPDDILLHHANWCVGTANKLKLLSYVRDQVLAKD